MEKKVETRNQSIFYLVPGSPELSRTAAGRGLAGEVGDFQGAPHQRVGEAGQDRGRSRPQCGNP